jgi:hypothetical protein
MEAGRLTVTIDGNLSGLNVAIQQMRTSMEAGRQSMSQLTNEVRNWSRQTDEADNSNKKITGSIIKAQVIFEALKVVLRNVVEGIKATINAFKETEIAEARLRAVIGSNITEWQKYATSIQNTTTIEDDSIIKAITLARTMGITKDSLKEVTDGAIGLSKAFNVDLNSAVKMSVLAHQGNYEALTRFIPALRNATTEVERQAIVQKAMANGIALAKSEADTFTGKLEQWKNIQSDLLEESGRIVSVVGKEIVTAMNDAGKGLRDWMTSAEGIEKISKFVGQASGFFWALWEIVKKLGDIFKNYFQSIIETITKNFEKLVGKGNEGTVIFTSLSVIIKLIALNFSLLGQFINFVIINIVDFILAIKESIGIIISFYKALKGEGTWEDVDKQVKKTGQAFWDLGKNAITNVKGMVTSVVDAFVDIKDNSLKEGQEMSDKFTKIVSDMQQKTTDILSGKIETPTVVGGKEESFLKISDTKSKTITMNLNLETGQFTQGLNDATIQLINFSNTFGKDLANMATIFNDKMSTVAEKITSTFQLVGDSIGNTMQIATTFIKQNYEDQLESLQEKHSDEIELIDRKTEEEIALVEKSNKTEAEKEKEITNIKKKGDKEKAESDYKLAKASYDLQKEQFEINKSMQVLTAGINYALGLIMLWSNVWSLGPIAGAAMGIIMSALLSGIYGANLGIILGSKFNATEPKAPSFASGGIVQDNIIANVRRDEMIITPEQQSIMWEMLQGNFKNQQINLILDGEIVKNWFISNQKKEALILY